MKKKKVIPHDFQAELNTRTSDYWEKLQRKNALKFFRDTVKNVPAYKDFLMQHRFKAESVKTWEQFKQIPLTNKKQYLKKAYFPNLIRNGLVQQLEYSSTSGSTGTPFYFPRSSNLEEEYSVVLESFLKSFTHNKRKKTLVIIAFGMGVWIGGLITYKAFELVSSRFSPLSLIAPGVNKKEIFNALRNLSKYYDQTILVGYPPFIKDVIDESKDEGINIQKLNIKILFAAEAFTEGFRDYLAEKTNIKNVCNETLNIYGTADIGAMAFETPTSILIRRLVIKNPDVAKRIFGDTNRTPTLAQYNPNFLFFEEINNEIILTGTSALPLVRYAVGDHGGVYTFAELKSILREFKIDISKEAKKHNVKIYELPFVYVYERTDLSATIYGLQIYPETLREVLLQKPFQDYLTGKFTLRTVFDSKNDQYLELNVEMKRNVAMNKKYEKRFLQAVVANLREKNSEFRELSDFLGKRAYPKIVFWSLGDSTHFASGIKQKWVKK